MTTCPTTIGAVRALRLAPALIALALLAVPAGAAARPHRILGVVPDGVGRTAAGASPFAAPVFAPRATTPRATTAAARARAAGATLPYHGGPVLHANRTHIIFWQPQGSGLSFEPGYTTLIEGYLQNVAADSHLPTNVFGLTGQYTDSRGPAAYDSKYGGSVLATDALPPNGCSLPAPPPIDTGPGWSVCLTDSQLQTEIGHVVAANGLPRTASDIYFLVTPNGLGSCAASGSGSQAGPDGCSLGGNGRLGQYSQSYCGYHSQSQGGLLYGVIPYDAVPGHCASDNPRPNGNPADPTISTLSHELSETVTDPLGDAWITSDGAENGDLCAQYFGPPLGGSLDAGTAWNQSINGAHYYTQSEWSNDDGAAAAAACQPSDELDAVTLHGARVVRGDRAVTFTGSARDPDGSISLLEWFFAGGKHSDGAKSTHVFTKLGTETVVLSSVDSALDFSYARQAVTVVAPPAPTVRFESISARTLGDSARPRLRFTSDAALATYTCQLDRAAAKPCRSPFTAAGLRRGRHTLRVLARDTFGQVSPRPGRIAFAVR